MQSLNEDGLLLTSVQFQVYSKRIQEQPYEFLEGLEGLGLDVMDDVELEYEMYTSNHSAVEMAQLSRDAFMLWAHQQETVLLSNRRGSYNQINKCDEYFEKALGWPEREFRHEFRMSRLTFDKLVMKLEENPIFISQGRKPQRAVRYQLATFLIRYASRGSDALAAAKKMGLGLGTVWLYCRRVTRALRQLSISVISWGDNERHTETMEEIKNISGLPNCIGIIDGSLIRLTDIPSDWGPVYFCRKKFPSINFQAICDHQRRFISYDMGWPGSMTDVTILKNSHLWKNRRQFFSGDQYLLADRGYPSSPYLLRPFTEPEVNEFEGQERARRLQFNKNLSHIRVRIEHAFGMLKGRFLSLKDLGRHDDVQEIYKVIQAMMVIHNLCVDWDDPYQKKFLEEGLQIQPEDDRVTPEDIDVTGYGNIGIEEGLEARVPTYETDDWHREEGHIMRNRILNQLFPLH